MKQILSSLQNEDPAKMPVQDLLKFVDHLRELAGVKLAKPQETEAAIEK